MSDLTPKQEKFCQCIAKGMTQSDAYRESYDAGDMLDKTIHEEASKTAVIPKLSTRIDELKKLNQEHLKYDVEAHFKELERLKELALVPSGKYSETKVSEAIKATVEQGKVCGLYVDKSEVKINAFSTLLNEIENARTTETSETPNE